MSTSFRLPLCSLVGLWAVFSLWHIEAAYDVANKPVTEDCLQCLCEAMSGCNATDVCVNGACGIFRITWGFWVDAGQLTVTDDTALTDEAFTNCVNDPICAANSIQNYMDKFGQDCNGDDRINCLDYGALHKLGYLGCKGETPYTFTKIFTKCLKAKERQERFKETQKNKNN